MARVTKFLLMTLLVITFVNVGQSKFSLRSKTSKSKLQQTVTPSPDSQVDHQSPKQQATTLLNDAAARCLYKLNLDFFKNFIHNIQFWQTWSHLEFVTLLNETDISKLITPEVRLQASRRAIQQWTRFQPNTTLNVPAYFKDIDIFQDVDFWDPKNKVIIWDDRQWLGLSYLQLFRHFGSTYKNASKFMEVAEHLYTLIIKNNSDPRDKNYVGLEWKPGSNYRNSVTNEQFLAFCGRLYSITNKTEYLDLLILQYKFLFKQPGKYINNNTNNVFPDADGDGGFYTYNQGMALQGLAYLAVFDPAHSTEYVTQLARMINGFTRYFKLKNSTKYILRELTTGTYGELTCGSVFRAMVFRHLIRSKMIFMKYEPVLWNQLLALAPILKVFILDNFQAMCKFSDTVVVYHWDEDTGDVHYYNEFNQFYVLYSGSYLFGIEELQTQGVSMDCQGVISLNYSSTRIKQVKLTTLEIDSYMSSYKHNRSITLMPGLNALNNILNESLCSSTNNRNILTLTVNYLDGSQATYTLAHLQHHYAQFSIIPDRSGEQIINKYGVRINSDCKNNKMTYESKKTAGSRIILSSQQPDCSKKSNIQLDIV